MKPNILIIVADQLTWRAIPTYGGKYGKTPNIDRIFAKGIAFDDCYTPCPLCQPARTAFWSSRYPHETNVLSNGQKLPVTPITDEIPTLGETFSRNGYEAVHFGKKHDAGGLRGFICAEEKSIEVEAVSPAWPVGEDTFRDRYTTVKAVEYLEKKLDEKPFIMVTDFVNPHEICSFVGQNQNIHEDIPINGSLPQLPDNFAFDDIANRPIGVQYICCSHNRQAQAAGWTEKNYQHYLAAYFHYMERMDTEIGLVLNALERTGKADDTMIVFMSDHGDSMAARGRVTKQVDLYEEVTRVPFIFGGKWVALKSKIIKGTPVSLLDLFPTLCGMADITIPKGVRGIDLTPVLKGQQIEVKREYVASEWHTEWGYTISPGRMIRNNRYKYNKYIEDGKEELFDLELDPFEMRNVACDLSFLQPLEQMRELFQKFLAETNDNFETLTAFADERWRSHPVGYRNHIGIAAPMQ